VNLTIAGGDANAIYDLYGASPMTGGALTNAQWYWLGSGRTCNAYQLQGQPQAGASYILGTRFDSNGDGITDAYSLLVLHADPNSVFAPSGIPYAWMVLHGLNPQTPGIGKLDPDRDALVNSQEYVYGTDPQKSEGFSIWLCQPGSFGLP
jgi:hypothetical protein